MEEIKCYKNTANGLQLIGVIDDYKSFTFTRKYTECGEWQLVLNANTQNAELVKEMNYIKLGSGVAGVVEEVLGQVGIDNIITYKGGELKGITNTRIVMPPTNNSYLHINKNPALVILDILNTQLAQCSDTKRRIPNVRIDSSIEVDTTFKITYDGRFSNVYTDISEIATANNIGWYADIVPIDDSTYAEIVFYVYSGIDRRSSQSTNSRFILSYSNDNIEQSNYQHINTIPTTALIAGQGEGVNRVTQLINSGNTGLDRKEVFIDARDINDSTLLPQRGLEKLAEYGDSSSYDIMLNQNIVNLYHSAYELGDIGTINDEVMNLSLDFRLTEITEIYEDNSKKLKIVCGYDKKNLGSAIKRSSSNTQNLLKVEGTGNTDSYLPLSGGTLTGTLSLAPNKNISTSGMDARNSDISNVNAIRFADPSSIATEGFVFPHSGNYPNNYDYLTVSNGKIYFQPFDESTGTQGSTRTVLHSGNYSTYALPVSNWINIIYPIGSIYMSVNSANPSTFFGGTWVAWGSGKVPVGVNTSDTSFNTVEKTGGAKTVTLTESQIPSHSHGCVERTGSETDYKFQFTGNLDTNSASTARRRVAAGSDYYAMTATTTSDISDFDKTANTGGGTAHSNLQPYITCYMWKRTA